jgi:hypothetical protein
MCTHATSRIGETSLQKCQKTKKSLGNIGIFLLLKPNFPHTNLIFFNGFPLSSMAFHSLYWLSDFTQRLSNFPQRLSTFQEIQENLFMARSIQKITI